MRTFTDLADDGLDGGGPSAVRADFPRLAHGVCGDPLSARAPRAHETGGRYGRFDRLGDDAVAECYAKEGAVDVTVSLTAQHGGDFEMQLCVPDGGDETEQCFVDGDKHGDRGRHGAPALPAAGRRGLPQGEALRAAVVLGDGERVGQ